MIIICGDKGTLQNRDFGFSHEVRAHAADSIGFNDLSGLVPNGYEFDVTGTFQDWHGGKFSSQAKTYGYKVYGLVAYEKDSERRAAERISDALDRMIQNRCELTQKALDQE